MEQKTPAAKLANQDAAMQRGNHKGEARAALDAIGIEEIAEQIAECVTYREIAESAGVSTGSLSNWLALDANAEVYARARS